MTRDRLTTLDERTCRQLLDTTDVGRLAVNDYPTPTVVPVNYVVHGDAIVFLTGEGRKLDAVAGLVPTASFQIDNVDSDRRAAWSVLVRGGLELVPEPGPELTEALGRLTPLAGGDRPHVVLLHVQSISGRRIAPDASWVLDHLSTNRWSDRDGSDLLG